MSITADRFRSVADGFTRRADLVGEHGWDRPAPCDGWVARDIVAHMVTWMPALLASGGVELPDGPDIAGDPAAAWRHLARSVQALLDDPALAGSSITIERLGTMSVDQLVGSVLLGDVFVHTWDLARAVGLDETLDEDLAAEMLAGLEPLDEVLRSSGHYGPRVAVADVADVQTRLIAFTGRTP